MSRRKEQESKTVREGVRERERERENMLIHFGDKSLNHSYLIR